MNPRLEVRRIDAGLDWLTFTIPYRVWTRQEADLVDDIMRSELEGGSWQKKWAGLGYQGLTCGGLTVGRRSYDTPGTWSAGYLFRDSAADHIWALNPRGPIDYVLVEGSITIFRALFAAWYPDRVPPLGPTAEEVFYNQRCRVIHV
jgi:hypothetical protein